MNRENDIKLHIFGKETTMQNDYRPPPGQFVRRFELHKPNTELEEKPQLNIRKEQSLLCNESLTKLRKNVHVPFNLLWKTKPIVGQRKLQRQIVLKPVDCGKEESIRTRPRICLQPAVSIDDVESKEKRDLLLNYMYTTEFRNAERDVNAFRALNKKENSACCCGFKDEMENKSYDCLINNPKCRITTEENGNIRVGSEMREKYYKQWDDHQRRACVNPTVYFWQHTDIPKNIHVEDGLITDEMKQQINEIIQTDKLRKPHDLRMTGYTAHNVQLAKGVPLRKNDFPVSHPMLTVQQAFNCHYEEDMDEFKNKPNSK